MTTKVIEGEVIKLLLKKKIRFAYRITPILILKLNKDYYLFYADQDGFSILVSGITILLGYRPRNQTAFTS